MKGLLIVFAAILVSSMAANYLEKRLCSVSATGHATLLSEDGSVELPARMIRVKDTVRYDMILPNNSIAASIIQRSDKSATYYYLADGHQCSMGYSVINLYYYSYNSKLSVDDFDVYSYGHDEDYIFAAIYFKGDSLVKEFLRITNNMNVTIEYDNVDYAYKHDKIDNAFSLTQEQCSDSYFSGSWDNATGTVTSLKCGFTDMPSNFCSLTANGTVYIPSEPEAQYVKMTRVGDFVRYDFYKDNDHQDLFASFVKRPDLDSYLGFYLPGLTMCNSTYDYFTLKDCEYQETTEDGRDIFSYDSHALYFDHNTGNIFNESFYFYWYDPSFYLDIDISYTSWDYSYVHNDVDKTFTLDYGICAGEIKSEARYAKTSLVCSAPKTKKPKLPGCAFQVDIRNMEYAYLGEDFVFHTKLMIKDENNFYMNKTNFNYGDEALSYLVRCDKKNAKGVCFAIERVFAFEDGNYSEDCAEGYDVSLEEEGLLFGFEYRGEPESVKCPDNSNGCMNYCTYDAYNECFTLKDDMLVAFDEGAVIFSYNTTIPTVEDFKSVDCEGNDLPAPVDICSAPDPSSSHHGSSTAPSSAHHGSSTSPSSTHHGSSGAHTSSKAPVNPSAASLSSASFAFPTAFIAVVAMLFALF